MGSRSIEAKEKQASSTACILVAVFV